MMTKKWCKTCGGKLQKRGKTKIGTQRYLCVDCGQSSVRKRTDLSDRHYKELFYQRLSSPLNIEDFAYYHTNMTGRALRSHFQEFWQLEIKPVSISISQQILIIDAKRLRTNCWLFVAKIPGRIVSWQFFDQENYNSWYQFLSSLDGQPTAVTCDGGKQMIKVMRALYPGIVIQRCHFHVKQRIRQLLSLHPKTTAAKEFKLLVDRISKVKTKHDAKAWLQTYGLWIQTYTDYLQQKTYYLSQEGKQKWHYTHRKLRSANYHVKQALPCLFRYLNYPKIPNTSNFVEGGVNSPLADIIHRHRGLTIEKQQVLIANYLAKHQ